MIGLFPKNNAFFDLFNESATNMHRTSELMLELCKSTERRTEIVGAIREVEHKGDRTTRTILRLLVRSFITPLEREDIHALASALDDVVDYIDESANSFVLLGVKEPIAEYLKQAELLVKASEVLAEAVGKLRSPKTRSEIPQLLHKVYDLESEGDAVHNKAMARLFSQEKDPIEILRWEKLCDFLEAALDACQRVANVLEMTILKSV